MSIPTYILNNNAIPSKWYISSLLDYLKNIPEEYVESDYKKLFDELTDDLNESIKSLDFNILIIFTKKLKFLEKINNYYDNLKKILNNILINEKVKHIVEEESIPVEIIFKYEEEQKKFELTKSNIKEKLLENKIIYEIPTKNITIFKTIEAFTSHFPNLAKYQEKDKINPFDIIKELNINKKINYYFEIIKEKISKTDIENDEYEKMYQEKIKDYVMNKIYEKIYPPEPSELDKKMYEKTKSISWIEPELIINKDYIFDNMLPDILIEFKQMNIAHSPFKKLNIMKRILYNIENLVRFNEGEDNDVGADDIGPILNYILIKAEPPRIFSDIEYIKIFLKNLKLESSIAHFESISNLIINDSDEKYKLNKRE